MFLESSSSSDKKFTRSTRPTINKSILLNPSTFHSPLDPRHFSTAKFADASFAIHPNVLSLKVYIYIYIFLINPLSFARYCLRHLFLVSRPLFPSSNI